MNNRSSLTADLFRQSVDSRSNLVNTPNCVDAMMGIPNIADNQSRLSQVPVFGRTNAMKSKIEICDGSLSRGNQACLAIPDAAANQKKRARENKPKQT
jgi:hypothetical protein